MTFTPYFSHHLDQVTRALLENGADPNKASKLGNTALIKACENGHEQVCLTMLTITHVSQQRSFYPCSHHLDQVARALIKNGAAVNSQDEEGYTALMLSAQSGYEQV